MRTENRKIGDLGENIAEKFLMKHGFDILERNYLRKWGEIDIVAKRNKKIHFVEIKTSKGTVTQETKNGIRPEENLHPQKLKRVLGRYRNM